MMAAEKRHIPNIAHLLIRIYSRNSTIDIALGLASVWFGLDSHTDMRAVVIMN